MSEMLQPWIGIIGVVIGGLMSYTAQMMHQNRTDKKKDKRQKHIAYSNFLLIDGENSPLVIPMQWKEPKDFEWETYTKGARRILFENLHLFDEKIVKCVLQIDFVGERAEVMGPEQEDTDEIFDLYSKIKDEIIKDYNNDLKK